MKQAAKGEEIWRWEEGLQPLELEYRASGILDGLETENGERVGWKERMKAIRMRERDGE